MDKPEGIRIVFGGDGLSLDDILSAMIGLPIVNRRAYATQFLLKLAILGIEHVYGVDGDSEEENLKEKSDAADSVLGALSILVTHDELAAAMEHVRQELRE